VIDYRLDMARFASLWAQASAAGVPLPGGPATSAAWFEPGCKQEVPR
jgi:hypothetical protein